MEWNAQAVVQSTVQVYTTLHAHVWCPLSDSSLFSQLRTDKTLLLHCMHMCKTFNSDYIIMTMVKHYIHHAAKWESLKQKYMMTVL